LETKYQKVKTIEIIEKDDGFWVKVVFANDTTWLPSLYDLGRILNMIGQCEDIKYPNGKGHKMTQEFINECFGGGEVKILSLVKKYKIPER
jgi:hypothetical protein